MTDNTPDPVRLVRQYYSDPEVVKSYITTELFTSEGILIDRFFRPNSTVLDIGCGAGRTSIALARKGFKVTGIDLVPEMIEAARHQASRSRGLDADFQVMDATNMNFPRQSFENALFSFNGFEHIARQENREKVLRDVFEILKPGGCFILTARSGLAFGRRWLGWVGMCFVYFRQQLTGNPRGFEFGDKIRKGEYHHYLSPFRLKALARNAGFEFLHFNSHSRIAAGKDPSPLTYASNDKMLFYVLGKKRIGPNRRSKE